MANVLGIDIGSYSIKAALFEVAFKGFNITDLYESSPLRIDELSKEENYKAQKDGLERFVIENGIAADQVIVAVSGGRISHRNLTLPFRDRKQIDKILPFELESYLPFELEDLVIDSQVTKRSEAESELIAFAIKKAFLSSLLELFADVELEPRIVDIDSLALANIVHLSNVNTEGRVGIIDIGHSKTNVCICEDGAPVFVRTILSGGRVITDQIRKDFDLTAQQAEDVKHKYGIMNLEKHPLQDKKQIRIAKSVGELYNPIVVELQQTLHNYEGMFKTPTTIDELYLCGGCSLIQNSDRFFSEALGRNVKYVECEYNGRRLKDKIGNRQTSMIQALALGARSAIKGPAMLSLSTVNFRKGEFVATRSFAGLQEKAKFIGLWVAVVVALYIVQFVVHYSHLATQSGKLQKQVIQEISAIMPDVPKDRLKSSKQALNIMKGRITEYENKMEILTSGLTATTALDILKEISSLIPATVSVDIRELNIDRNKISIKGDTDSFTSVDKIVSSLEKYDLFEKVQKGAISDAPDPTKKRFSISIVVGKKEEGE